MQWTGLIFAMLWIVNYLKQECTCTFFQRVIVFVLCGVSQRKTETVGTKHRFVFVYEEIIPIHSPSFSFFFLVPSLYTC